MRVLDPRQHRDERVDHRVADREDARFRDRSLGEQVDARLGRVGEQEVGDRVSDHPVDLLGHRAIEAPQTRLDVSDSNSKFRAHQSSCDSRVYVTINHHEIRRVLLNYRFKARHNLSGLLRVASGTNLQVEVRGWNFQLLKKNIGHVCVIVLAGVNQQLLDAVNLT